MPNTKDLVPDSTTIQAILMGASGAGKTFLAGTFPGLNVMDFDGKVGVVRNPEFVKRFGIRSIEYQQFTEKSRFQGVAVNHNAYDDACRYFDYWMSPERRNTFETWTIDSATSLSEVARNKALMVLGGNKLSRAHATAVKTGVVMMQQQDWGAERSLTEQFIRMVKDSGKNLLVLVHQKEFYNEEGVIVAVKPLFVGQSVEIISAMFKDIWHLRTYGGGISLKRVLTAEFDGITAARSELGIGTIEDPTYDKIIARIREKAVEAANLSQSVITAAGGSQTP